MDSDQFDQLTTRLTARQSRRRNLGLLTVLGIGAGLPALDAAAKKGKKKRKKKNKNKSGTTTSAPPSATTTRAPVTCPAGRIRCAPDSDTCCTPAEVVTACKEDLILEVCPQCQDPNAWNCGFCRSLVEMTYFHCCDQFAVSPGPAAVQTCLCDAGRPCT